MFYRNTLKTEKTKQEEFEYSLFNKPLSTESDELQKTGSVKRTYNFLTEDGDLKTGYGFEDIKMPTSFTDLDNESLISIRGDEVKAIWKMKWYDSQDDINCYYLFYYNDEGYICYDNIFRQRLATFIAPNVFTDIPFALYYRVEDEDMLLFFGEGQDLLTLTSVGSQTVENVPVIKSCCAHYGKLFAITATGNNQLVYTEDLDITAWTDEKTKRLDFSDERGTLNKIISFDDYIYVFRDYGITQLSIYGSNEDFSINHMYLSDSYIYPNTIAQSGDRVYFLERYALKCFNGSSVSEVEIACKDLISSCRQENAYATCYEGKIYLACRCDYGGGESVGCESYSGGYKNNTLIIHDIESGYTEIVRGVDINQVLALNNPYKSKLVACFNGQYKGNIGQLTTDGKIFGSTLGGVWQSTDTDFGHHSKKKRIKSFTVKTSGDITVTISSDKMSKKFEVSGKANIQKIRTNIVGNVFNVKITSGGETTISNFVLFVSEKQ